ncbi:MAG: TFIIB-type zinc ribbon-containing protein [Planctomycetota bacterium]|jgi:Zn-finger nucleic acid-binding protein
MKCPGCDGGLKSITYEGIRIETCPGCGGEWLDEGELGHVNRAREVRFDKEERRAVAETVKIKGVKLADVDRDLACPKCGGQTDAINYGGDTGIIIDRCTSCGGIWLDAGEVEKIQMVIEGWQDGLPDDLAKYGPRLRQVAEEVDRRDDVTVSRVGFVNAIINGILDVLPSTR